MALESVKELREKTGAGLLDCQKALGEAAGDVEKAIRRLREGGLPQSGKPEKVIERTVEGQVERFYKEVCFLEQPFVKDDKGCSVAEIVQEAIVRFGVNVAVRRFARFQLGETAPQESPAGGAPGA